MRSLALTLALLVSLAMGFTMHAALHPTLVAGTPSPTAGTFLTTGEAPALPYVPLALPEWAPTTSPWGAPVVDVHAWEVRYADGAILWLDDNGDAWWDPCLVAGADHTDCAYASA